MVVLKDKDNPCAFVAMRLEIYIEDSVARKETRCFHIMHSRTSRLTEALRVFFFSSFLLFTLSFYFASCTHYYNYY